MTTIPERVAFIRKIHLFSKLSEDDLNDVAEALTDVTYQPGERIIEQGSRGETFYILYKGYVKVTRKRDSKEVVLAQLVPQDYFGEEELFKGGTRTANIIAVTEASALALHKSKLGDLMKRAPAVKPSFDVAIETHRLWRKLQFKWIRPDEVVYFLARKHPILLWRDLVIPVFLLAGVGLFFAWAWLAAAFL
ncbi:MAG: cyclic nucleotide-binding domain-containing protein, partial [Chloroflexota bacterium]